MAKLPQPPSASRLRTEIGLHDGDEVAVATHTVLWRIHATQGRALTPWNRLRHYGPVDARFEPHEPPPRVQDAGVAYFGLSVRTCLAEVFQRTRVIDRHAHAAYVTGLQLRRTVTLLDLTGTWPTRAGASQAINSGRHDVTSHWARRIAAAYPHLDGLWHRSTMDAGPCVTLFTPAGPALPDAPAVSRPLSDPALADGLAHAAGEIGYRLL